MSTSRYRNYRNYWFLNIFNFIPAKYCRLIESEGGLELLEELINSNTSPAPYAKILELASIVRENVNCWQDLKNQENMEEQSLEYDG